MKCRSITFICIINKLLKSKHVKLIKKLVLVILLLIGILFIFFFWYRQTYSMETARTYVINSPSLERKLLIATQGSEFKDVVTKGIADYYSSQPIFIKVIDISSLDKIDATDYSAMVIIHTWQNWEPPVEVKYFIEKNVDFMNRVIVLTTSGEGSYKMEGVDAITGESILTDAPLYTAKIIDKLDSILKTK